MSQSNREYNGGKWTASRYHSFIKSALRRASSKWPPKYTALNDAFVDKRINEKTGRLSKHFRCAECKGVFPTSEVQVDHKEPVVPVTGFSNWDETINRMFCEKEGFQVLCKPCHSSKSQQERKMRKTFSGK